MTDSASPEARTFTRLRALSWLALVMAILQRYFLQLGSSQRSVNLITVALLLLALGLRVAAWRIAKRTPKDLR